MRQHLFPMALALAIMGGICVGCACAIPDPAPVQTPKPERLVMMSQLVCGWSTTVTIVKDTKSEREFLIVGDNTNHTVRELTANNNLKDALEELTK